MYEDVYEDVVGVFECVMVCCVCVVFEGDDGGMMVCEWMFEDGVEVVVCVFEMCGVYYIVWVFCMWCVEDVVDVCEVEVGMVTLCDEFAFVEA